MNAWRTMDSAPRDGTEILACRDNGCAWEFYLVRWDDTDPEYPWDSGCNAYPDGRLTHWMPLTPPDTRNHADWGEAPPAER
jgi:hypothetical protein